METDTPVSKPFADYDDFDACVRDNQDKEDPEAFCGWLQDRAKEVLSDPEADTVLTSLTTEFVSSVDTPAQDSEWLIFKDADTPRSKARQVERPYVFANDETTAKAADVDVREENEDGERQIAYAAVLIPDEVDKQGDIIPPYVVERTAHEYMAKYRKMDTDHDLNDGAGVPVESWVLKEEAEFDLPEGGTVTYPEGTWLIGKRFVDDEWDRVKSGELNGFSIYGGANAVEVDELEEELKQARKAAEGNGEDEDNMGTEKQFTEDDVEAIMGVIGGTIAAHGDALIDDVEAELEDEFADDTVAEVMGMVGGTFEAQMEDLTQEVRSELMNGAEDGEGGMEEEDEEGEESGEEDMEETQMDNEDTTGGDAGTNESTESDDGPLPDDTPEWAKSLSKDVRESVDDVRNDVDDLRGRVADLEKEVGEDEPNNDRMEDDDGNDRMKGVAKEAAREEVADMFGVEDADDRDVVRKGVVEQVAGDEDDDTPDEDYSDIVDDAVDEGSSNGTDHENKRFAEARGN